MTTILVLGQTPPPLHGQAIMIQQLLAGNYRGVRLLHVRMNFSKELDSVGKVRPGKVLHLLSVLARIVYIRLRNRVDVLYYPPAGPKLVPVLRDIFLLILTRWMFPKTIFHFHAGGLTEIYSVLPGPLRWFFQMAYSDPDVIIRMSARTPESSKLLKSKKEFIIPYGVADEARAFLPRDHVPSAKIQILFVGTLSKEKGVLVLLRACHVLLQTGARFQTVFVGRFQSDTFREEVQKFVSEAGLSTHVKFTGTLSGSAKWAAFAKADIFCFPTFYHSEAFPVVLLEAMSFGLPIVTTNWRGIPDIIQDSGCAFVSDIQNEHAITESLSSLIGDPDLRRRMGELARKHFLEHFTIERHYELLREAFDCVGKPE